MCTLFQYVYLLTTIYNQRIFKRKERVCVKSQVYQICNILIDIPDKSGKYLTFLNKRVFFLKQHNPPWKIYYV